ncbi:MFS multidrug transporter [Penicillium nucicola]|uniref:MFS multidrug transporter n=1 Tax=Penicillium nucicola TaxID=1850975 RepID=UPI002544FE35|nr:MFS multidrug transporter [Penicillium nucicola]KAJ5753944.1 MFS multidrug transporter [Penicillium nucicola]
MHNDAEDLGFRGEEVTEDCEPTIYFHNIFQECLFVLTATMAVGQTSFFTGLVTVITASIGHELDMSSTEITWISAGMALTSGAFLLPCGKIADVFGRKRIFTTALAGFSAALLVSGFAKSPVFMDIFSGILGLFAAVAVPPAVGTLGTIYEKPSKRKNRAFACFSAGNPLGFVGGMLISGIAAEVANWRVSFWTLSVLYAAFTVLAIWTMPGDPILVHLSLGNFWKRCDPLGMLLSVTGIAFLSASLSSLAGDAPRGWREPYVLSLLILGIALISIFLWWQSIYSIPLMPLHVWKNRTFSLASTPSALTACGLVATLSLGYTGFAASQFWMALYMQRVQKLSSLEITVRLLPLAINGLFVNVICGLILHKVSSKLLMIIASLAYTTSFLIMSFTDDNSSYWGFYFPPWF